MEVSLMSPILLFIDDLQFGDVPSLDLLVRLSTSDQLKSIGFCFAYRDNEVISSHPWAIRLSRLETITEEIHVLNLALGSVASMVGDLTRRGEEAYDFASIVHTKTLGNPFFTLQLLEILQRQSILRYD